MSDTMTKGSLKENLERIKSSNSYDSAKLAYYVRKNAGNGKLVIKREKAVSPASPTR
jgi:hypothetical protein